MTLGNTWQSTHFANSNTWSSWKFSVHWFRGKPTGDDRSHNHVSIELVTIGYVNQRHDCSSYADRKKNKYIHLSNVYISPSIGMPFMKETLANGNDEKLVYSKVQWLVKNI